MCLQALVLASGSLMVVFNNVKGVGNRWPLSVALSEDGGQSWPWVRDLETKDGSITVGRMPRDYLPFHRTNARRDHPYYVHVEEATHQTRGGRRGVAPTRLS